MFFYPLNYINQMTI